MCRGRSLPKTTRRTPRPICFLRYIAGLIIVRALWREESRKPFSRSRRSPGTFNVQVKPDSVGAHARIARQDVGSATGQLLLVNARCPMKKLFDCYRQIDQLKRSRGRVAERRRGVLVFFYSGSGGYAGLSGLCGS